MNKAKFNPEIKQIVDSILLNIPSVISGKMFGYPAYFVNKKLAACIYEKGVGIKVPQSIAGEMVGKEGITPFQPLGRVKMKEWIQINRENPEDYLKDIKTFEASVSYVGSLGKKA
jgi:hypothetical protein